MYSFGYKEVGTSDENQNKDEQPAGFVVEQKADEKEIGVSHVASRRYAAEDGIDYSEECPEVELREQQRGIFVECEYAI